jgi:serine/threonine-protein kinase SRPK3
LGESIQSSRIPSSVLSHAIVSKVGAIFRPFGLSRIYSRLFFSTFTFPLIHREIREKRHSALKVVKSAGRYAETARDEIQLLSKVAEANPLHPGRSHIVSFLDSFDHNGPEETHVCIVFEPLGEHLLSLIERNKKKGVPVPLVKTIARQVLLGLEYLHDECDLVHTDIKPENIREFCYVKVRSRD